MLKNLQVPAESWSAQQVLQWAFLQFHPNVALASAFGAEGIVLIDIAARLHPDFRVFTIDTHFLFPETYDLMDTIEARYGIRIERVHPAVTPEDQAGMYGEALWSWNPDQCCNLRKLEPLKKKLSELGAWITAIRRDQTPTRAGIRKVEWDSKFELLKINPLADWTTEQVWSYIRRNGLPYNPLHDRNYPSIGCTHCTRAVRPGEQARAGRWPGFQKTECGLHDRKQVAAVSLLLPC